MRHWKESKIARYFPFRNCTKLKNYGILYPSERDETSELKDYHPGLKSGSDGTVTRQQNLLDLEGLQNIQL